ncbi:MAG TPA: helix-turn-helix transcriptional regulator [Mycobacteriales bacterium]|jgi:transcriptional regulator with XRE-family HTH domain|nr:helix-turn-helix transcriptional regulator [Mycobacteriales bacterium]
MIGGELVREGRKRADLTQKELADRAGTTQSAIARLESGRSTPSLETVERLLRLCGFQLLVELAPYDDSDLRQAVASADLTPAERAARLGRTVRRLHAMRESIGA